MTRDSNRTCLDLLVSERHLIPWGGVTVMFHPVPGGAVEASSRGVAALGQDESEALARLWELLDRRPTPATGRAEILPLTSASTDSPPLADPPSPAWQVLLARESA